MIIETLRKYALTDHNHDKEVIIRKKEVIKRVTIRNLHTCIILSYFELQKLNDCKRNKVCLAEISSFCRRRNKG